MDFDRSAFTEHYRSIDFIKGICIIIIIITHYNWEPMKCLRYLFPFWIDMAVPMFMIISGFLYGKSFYKYNINTFEMAYNPKNFYRKIIRYTVPFLIAFCFEVTLLILVQNYHFSFKEIIYYFLRGGIGPGSYYYPVMIQFVFLFPVIFFIIQKYDLNGLAILGFLNFVFELLKKAYNLNEDCYRLLIFRYIFVIAFGCYMGKDTFRKKSKLYPILGLIGFGYIILFRYCGFTPLITNYWTGTCFWACMYIIPISVVFIENEKLHCRILELIGKASYNIFLVQMVYYTFFLSKPWGLCINIVICLLAGILFYFVERPITKFITQNFWKLSTTLASTLNAN